MAMQEMDTEGTVLKCTECGEKFSDDEMVAHDWPTASCPRCEVFEGSNGENWTDLLDTSVEVEQ